MPSSCPPARGSRRGGSSAQAEASSGRRTAASAALTLVIALVTRDIRASGNVTGLLALPAVIAVAGLLFLVSQPGSLVVAGIVMLGVAGGTYWAAQRWITFERYLE